MIHKFMQRLMENESIDPELQEYLSGIGYYGRTAKCLHCKMIGVQRPGWVQVFELHIRAKRKNGGWEDKFGICRSDERDGTYEIQLFDDQQACRDACQESTSGMITHGRGPGHWVKTMLMSLFVVVLAIAVVGGVLSLGTPTESPAAAEPR